MNLPLSDKWKQNLLFNVRGKVNFDIWLYKSAVQMCEQTSFCPVWQSRQETCLGVSHAFGSFWFPVMVSVLASCGFEFLRLCWLLCFYLGEPVVSVLFSVLPWLFLKAGSSSKRFEIWRILHHWMLKNSSNLQSSKILQRTESFHTMFKDVVCILGAPEMHTVLCEQSLADLKKKKSKTIPVTWTWKHPEKCSHTIKNTIIASTELMAREV